MNKPVLIGTRDFCCVVCGANLKGSLFLSRFETSLLRLFGFIRGVYECTFGKVVVAVFCFSSRLIVYQSVLSCDCEAGKSGKIGGN